MEISAFYILIYTIEGFIFGNYAIRLFDSKFHWHLQVSMLFIFYSGLYLLSRLELSWSCNTVTFFAANFCWLKPERIRAFAHVPPDLVYRLISRGRGYLSHGDQ